MREKTKFGFNAGLMVDYYFAENYAFGSGLSLLLTGGVMKYRNGTALNTNGNANGNVPQNGSVAYQLQYMRLPLGIKLKTHTIGRFGYFADLGFDPMTRIVANADYTSATGEQYHNIGVKKSIRLFALGYHISAGLKYPLGGNAALIGGITYMSIFTDITPGSGDKITANNLLLRLGIAF
jgi:hypothetical protein